MFALTVTDACSAPENTDAIMHFTKLVKFKYDYHYKYNDQHDCESQQIKLYRGTHSSPEVCAALAAISHMLTALIQADSKRLHSSSLLLTC